MKEQERVVSMKEQERVVSAGRAADRRVAYALGWRNMREGEDGETIGERPNEGLRPRYAFIPAYSTDDRAALALVSLLAAHGWLMVVKVLPEGFALRAYEETNVHVRYCVSGQWVRLEGQEGMRRAVHAHPVGLADTLPLAVTRCALACLAEEETAEDDTDDLQSAFDQKHSRLVGMGKVAEEQPYER